MVHSPSLLPSRLILRPSDIFDMFFPPHRATSQTTAFHWIEPGIIFGMLDNIYPCKSKGSEFKSEEDSISSSA